MTYVDDPQRDDYTATSSQTVFAYTFRILDEAHLNVYSGGTLQTLTTHYTVSGVGNAGGGNVTFLTGVTSGVLVAILRATPNDQNTDYTAGGIFPAESHETALDKLTMEVQDVDEKVGRAIKFEPSSILKDIDAPDGTSASDRGGKVWAWDSAGTALELLTATTVDAVSVIAVKGDIVQGDASGAAAKLAIGTDRQILYVATDLLAYKDPNFYSILDFGATSGGTAAANTTAINLAITTVNAAGGGLVWIPKGTYSVTGITMKSNVTLMGVGKTSLLSLDTSADTAVITMGVVNDVIIESIGIDGNSGSQTSGSPSNYNGIRLVEAATNCRFTNNDITDCLSTAIFIDKAAGSGPNNVRVEGNYIHATGARVDNTDRGIWARNSTNVSIDNNYMTAVNGYGITAQLCSQVKIQNNFVINTTTFDSIMVFDSDRTIVTGNMCINHGDTGIVVELSDYFSVTGNHIFTSQQDGIVLSGSSYGTVSANSILDSSQDDGTRFGIAVQSSSATHSVKNTIVGNMIRDVTSASNTSIKIFDSNQSGHVIIGNRVDGATNDYGYQITTDIDFAGVLRQSLTLAAAASTIAVTSEFLSLTGDGGGNTVTNITGGRRGMILNIFFNDSNVTITDTSAGTANTINLSAAFTSTGNDMMTILNDGNKWFETSRSVN